MTLTDEEKIERVVDAYANKSILPILEQILERMEDMATKGDLKEMREEMREEMSSQIGKAEERIVRTLRSEANENYLNLVEKIDESIALIGIHTQDKATQQQHKHLETRVERIETHLELAA
jgi:2',3'-cyclic-nucleotide 2'-phosphodiesterase (5'-nucleotidase family)